jgi:capsular polysaccharide biosynthesis protein
VRAVENEMEIRSLLMNFGFEFVVFESLSFVEQIKLMHETKIFVSIHGAGFSNMMFMQSKSYVVELINRDYAKSEYTFPFWKLSSATNLNYSGILCPVVDQSKILLGYGKNKKINENDFLVNQNILVPADELEKIIQKINSTF